MKSNHSDINTIELVRRDKVLSNVYSYKYNSFRNVKYSLISYAGAHCPIPFVVEMNAFRNVISESLGCYLCESDID